MRTRIVIAITTLLFAAAAHAGERFSATGVSVKLKSGTVIKNDSRSITAYRVRGKSREVLRVVPASRRPAASTRLWAGATPVLDALINEAAQTHRVDPHLVAAVMRRESRFNANAVSPVGASGLMQLMPRTARALGVTDVFDPRQNIFGGARYLRTLLDQFDGDIDLTLAAYNAGPGAVAKHKGVPPYGETKAYVKAVRRYYEQSLN